VIYRAATQEVAWGINNQTTRIYRQYPVFEDNPLFNRPDDLRLSSQHLLRNLIYLNLAVFVGAGLAGYWLAKRTLAPIEAVNEQQKRFVADASHELRTPITALKMETEVALMDTGANATALRAVLESNFEETQKLERLLNNLLRLSQLEATELEEGFTVTPVQEIVDEAIHRTHGPAEAKHITVTATVPDAASVYGDQESVTELLTILLDNAVKYSHEASAITVGTSIHTDHVTISVRDHGVGIEPKALEHIFDRFYRADTARTSNGHGLGLSIAKQIADLHHGTITVKSTAGKGTTVLVQLPVSPKNID
jgi:two-component system, OmpR family, sensor histidine kinase CiaH